MTADEWSQRVSSAALEVARATPESELAGSPAERVGRLLLIMGRAAGHADQLAGSGSIAATARRHFRAELLQAGATALRILQDSWRRQERPRRTNEEATAKIADARVLAGRPARPEGQPLPAGHAGAGLGAAIVSIARAIETIPLDDQHLTELDDLLESVLAHCIAAVARS